MISATMRQLEKCTRCTKSLESAGLYHPPPPAPENKINRRQTHSQHPHIARAINITSQNTELEEHTAFIPASVSRYA